MEKEVLLKKRIQELCETAYQRDIVTFTDFLDLNELHIMNSLKIRQWGVTCRCFGGYEMSERQVAAFIPDALSYDWEFPIRCLKVEHRSRRYGERLSHRDYLGALIHLGIDRSILGDILVEEGCAWIFCLDRMAEYLTQELIRVRHTEVTTTVWEGGLPDLARRYQEIIGTVSSVRLDAVIGVAFSTSRNSILPLIEGGKIFVNGKMVTSNGSQLKEGDIVSVRGMGKFQYMECLSKTKKGRTRIIINRYS